MTIHKSLTTVTTLSKLIAIWLYLFLPFAGFYLGIEYQKLQTPRLLPQTVIPSSSITTPVRNTASVTPVFEKTFCIQDTRTCPDGTSVSRQGPNCEFAPCERMEP